VGEFEEGGGLKSLSVYRGGLKVKNKFKISFFKK